MPKNFTEQSQRIMQIAGDEARRLKHGYIGTEHILLGLLQYSGPIADSLKRLGLKADRVRDEIEKIASIGAENSPAGELPLTPRSRQVIDYAVIESQLMKQALVDPEHLLLGLIREPDGVAGQVLRNLGAKLETARDEVFKIRLMQIKIVARIVRPVRSGMTRKRKMREELLAHLTAIYEQERANQSDPVAALQEAARRFGDPAELTRELQSALPFSERVAYRLELWLGWRAPESAARYVFRQSAQLFILILSVCILSFIAAYFREGNGQISFVAVRPLFAALLVGTLDYFLIGLLYFKSRDAWFGAFGARKSLANVFVFATSISLIVLISGIAFVAISEWDMARAVEMFPMYCAGGLFIGISTVVTSRNQGPTEISDALWALMDIAE